MTQALRRMIRRLVLASVLLVAGAACVDTPDSYPIQPETTGVEEEAGEEMPPEADENACGISYGEPPVAVIRRLILVEQEDGVAPGLNLDGIVSNTTDPRGCKKGDLTDPDGNTGIDNQFAFLVPALLALAGEGLTSAIERAINTGGVLLMIAMDRIDDTRNDACVEVELFRGEGEPVVGGLGAIEPGQTFDRDTDRPGSFIPDAILHDGMVTAGPVELEVPMQISNFDLFLSIREATLQFVVENDGSLRGIIAGALVVDEVLALLDEVTDGTELIAGARTLIANSADLDPDANGECQKLSIAIEFEAVPAFLFPDDSAGESSSP